MKIIVLNLPREVTELELANLFKNHGKVESATLVLNKDKGTSKGFGFVEMPDSEEANNAIKALHNKKVGGNKIRAKVADK